ncbi:kinase-like domain-containing protein [Armillaria borealis]|uniref:Kinase-like domain-containing protein n=1 Tax=Armillaria borealis TaxID=47425 RepID=A0AA39JXL9_9AGAR|nr:kinase-like domain-containing protein [Armillaria borealis]
MLYMRHGATPHKRSLVPHIAHTMSIIPTTIDDEDTILLVFPTGSVRRWDQINLDDEESDVRVQIRCLIRDVPYLWRSVELISPLVETMIMDVLQQELDDVSGLYRSYHYKACLKSLRALSKARNIVPSSFSCRNVAKEGTNPICGGGFADIWKGCLHDTQVCLKVLRLFIPEKAREKLLRDFCQEALVWRQLRHPNILPFLGVNEYLFAPSYCLISPWMINGNIMSYLEAHPDHDRLTSLVQVAEGMKYLHNHDPPVVHADIRGANILVMDDICCCLADFGLSLFAESQALNSSSQWMGNGCIRWLAPEYMDSTLFNQSYLTARDVYAYGCTVVEIFTGEPPFSNIKNDAGVIHEVLIKQSRPPRPPSNIFPDDGLWELVIACLSTMSSQRPNVAKISEILARLQTPFLRTLAGSDPWTNVYHRPSYYWHGTVHVDQNLDDKLVVPKYFLGKRRRLSSPKPRGASSACSANLNLHIKSKNIDLEPSLATKGIPRTKRIRVPTLPSITPTLQEYSVSHHAAANEVPIQRSGPPAAPYMGPELEGYPPGYYGQYPPPLGKPGKAPNFLP